MAIWMDETIWLKFHADGELKKKRGKRKEKNCAARSAVLCIHRKDEGKTF
jgi:hypothetical protein